MTFSFKHPSKYKKLSTGAPPKSGPTPQGLNIDYNTVSDRDWETILKSRFKRLQEHLKL